MGHINSTVNPHYIDDHFPSPRPPAEVLELTGNTPSYTGGTYILSVASEVLELTAYAPSADVVTPGGAYASQIESLSPVAYWQFEETSGGILEDSTANGHDGTYTSSNVTHEETGLLADTNTKRYGFTTAADIVLDTAISQSFPYSFACVVHLKSGNFSLLTNTAGDAIDWRISGTQLICTDNDYGEDFNVGNTLTTGSPIHIGVSVDASYVATLYVDGAVHGSTVQLYETALSVDEVYTGAYDTISFVDDMSLFDTALSATDFSDIYDADTGTPLTPVVIIGNIGEIELGGYAPNLLKAAVPLAAQLEITGYTPEARDADKYFLIDPEVLSTTGGTVVPDYQYNVASEVLTLTENPVDLIWLNNIIQVAPEALLLQGYNCTLTDTYGVQSEQINVNSNLPISYRTYNIGVPKSPIHIIGGAMNAIKTFFPQADNIELSSYTNSLDHTINFNAEQLNLTGNDNKLDSTIRMPSEQLNLVGHTLSMSELLPISSSDINLTGWINSLGFSYFVEYEQLNDTGNTPVVLITYGLIPESGQLDISTYNPSVQYAIPVDSSVLELTTNSPEIGSSLAPPAEELELTTYAPIVNATDIPYEIEYTDLYIIPEFGTEANISISGLEFDTNVAQQISLESNLAQTVHFECQVKTSFDSEVDL